MTDKLTEDDIEIYDFRSGSGKVRVNIDSNWYFNTPEEAESFKKQILANQKLREVIDKAIKSLQNGFSDYCYVFYSDIHADNQKEVQDIVIKYLQNLINEADK